MIYTYIDYLYHHKRRQRVRASIGCDKCSSKRTCGIEKCIILFANINRFLVPFLIKAVSATLIKFR